MYAGVEAMIGCGGMGSDVVVRYRGRNLYKLKTPAALFRDWMGKTQTSDIPRPTVKPIETETN